MDHDSKLLWIKYKIASLEAREQTPPRLLGLITAQQVKDELGIKDKTLKRWEDNGLRRYQPPLEDTRKIFYRVSDILVFLGVENGKN
ncbi:XRE family transcriptional regulator [Streptococcus suis]|uniref:XRE family transcriptional regulator n=1 Tax=Streptococcus suis TaxID=1307 RepID=UPI001EE8C9D4|nr:XRE family transcriptional regulator [Streptococcus suis]MBS8088034.1 XRE family transcriptional regulator [Streptococcus suis]MCH1564471.1 XRE family transcriptional regulator [Streptococcus suis]MCH1628790.1 XRE family transcriptional regulator [Streptococcus suis]HEM6496902.1 XRE family transcriptional regulator [Streptococcus suis]